MKKNFLLAFFLICIALISPPKTLSAETLVVSSSAQVYSQEEKDEFNTRVSRLQKFLKSYNSPLEHYAINFVKASETYNLDYRLLVAISGVESTFGKRIPYNSYNAFGWANGKYKFNSWEESIELVSKTLREKYYNKGLTNISEIARRWAPPSKTWATKVKYFMEKIDPVPVEFDL